jgi:hypothetical protein
VKKIAVEASLKFVLQQVQAAADAVKDNFISVFTLKAF